MWQCTEIYESSNMVVSITMGFMHSRKHRRRGRIPKDVYIVRRPATEGLTPLSKSTRVLFASSVRAIYIDPAEIEAQRLVDLEGLSQKEAGEIMGVSRGTVWRLLQAARKKLAQSLAEGKTLLVWKERNEEAESEPE